MKKILKIVVPILLLLAIVISIGWYIFQYNPSFARDLILQQAQKQKDEGNYKLSVLLYDFAYGQYHDDAIAIELAQLYKADGNYTKAEHALTKAIENGAGLELYLTLSQLYVEQNKLRDAVLMLDKVSDGAVKAQLDSLRPAAPVANAASGTYMQYITVEFTAEGTLYVNQQEDYPSMDSDAYLQPIHLSDGETTLFAVSVAENGLVSPLAVYHYVVGSVVEEVKFTDPAFAAAVRAQLGVDESYVIYSNKLWELKEFSVPTEVTSCDDLKWMPNLETLTIHASAVSNYTVLQELAKLETLSILGSRVTDHDLQIIATLPNMEKLTLQDCGISSIAPLTQCTGLVYLDLSSNAIRDISALSDLTKLQHLSLRNNAVIYADALAKLTKLQELDLAYNSLTDTKPLAALTGLIKLDVSANDLQNTFFTGLDSLVNLRHFAAAHNNLINVDILSKCTQLETLDVSYNTLLDIDVAAKLTNLVTLNFSHNEVWTLPKFSTSCALQTIDGSYNALTSLTALSGLENLTHIYMDYADCNTHDSAKRLTSIDSLKNCPKLEEVSVYGTKVRKVSALTDKGILVIYTPA